MLGVGCSGLGLWVEWEDGAADVAVGEREQVARAGAGGVHPNHARGDGIVGPAMRDGGLDDDDGELRRVDALAAPLAEVEGWRLAAGEQDGKPRVTNDGARAHVETVARHGGEMALLVLQFKF